MDTLSDEILVYIGRFLTDIRPWTLVCQRWYRLTGQLIITKLTPYFRAIQTSYPLAFVRIEHNLSRDRRRLLVSSRCRLNLVEQSIELLSPSLLPQIVHLKLEMSSLRMDFTRLVNLSSLDVSFLDGPECQVMTLPRSLRKLRISELNHQIQTNIWEIPLTEFRIKDSFETEILSQLPPTLTLLKACRGPVPLSRFPMLTQYWGIPYFTNTKFPSSLQTVMLIPDDITFEDRVGLAWNRFGLSDLCMHYTLTEALDRLWLSTLTLPINYVAPVPCLSTLRSLTIPGHHILDLESTSVEWLAIYNIGLKVQLKAPSTLKTLVAKEVRFRKMTLPNCISFTGTFKPHISLPAVRILAINLRHKFPLPQTVTHLDVRMCEPQTTPALMNINHLTQLEEIRIPWWMDLHVHFIRLRPEIRVKRCSK
jgi:hypothetical protein